MAPKGLVNSLNRIREISSEVYHQYIPIITEDTDISAFGKPILTVPQVQNEFMSNLINRIVYTSVNIKTFNNPLKVLEGDRIPLGYAGQELYVNPAEGRQFDVNDFAGLLVKYEADVKQQYMQVNSDLQYAVTASRSKLQKAFTSWENLNEFIDGITNSLYQGAYIDEWNQTKGLVTSAYQSNRVNIAVIPEVKDEESGKAFVKLARKTFLDFQSPSTEFNAWKKVGGEGRPITTWVDRPEDIVFIVTNQLRANLDVDVLASAFNIDRTTLMGNIITVPNFNIYDKSGNIVSDGSAIQGIMADRAWFRIKEQDRQMDEFYNANNRTWQYYLNIVKMYNYSLFADAVVFATSAPKIEATGINFGTASVELSAGDYEGLDVSTTPAESTDEITYEVTSGEASQLMLTPTDNGRHLKIEATAEATGDYTITATAGSATATLTVTITA